MARVTVLLFFIAVMAVAVAWLVLADAAREEQRRLELSDRD
jgi:hypothetical protein